MTSVRDRNGSHGAADRTFRPERDARLVRQVLRAIPPELDDFEDDVCRELVEEAAKAAVGAAKADERERPLAK